MTPEDLDAAVVRAQQGDAGAVEVVLAAVQDGVHRLALRMTGSRDDALDAAQEILIKVLTKLSTFAGDAAFTTWVHRVAVNHLLDRQRSNVEQAALSFTDFADDLRSGLEPAAPNAEPDLDLLAREVKHGCTLALLTCLDRDQRVAYILGEVFGVSSTDGAWICSTTEAAYRKRLSRARDAIRAFVESECGLVAGPTAACHCRRRVRTAVRLGRIDPAAGQGAHDVLAAVREMETLYDTAALIRSVPDATAPEAVGVQIRRVLESGQISADRRHVTARYAVGCPRGRWLIERSGRTDPASGPSTSRRARRRHTVRCRSPCPEPQTGRSPGRPPTRPRSSSPSRPTATARSHECSAMSNTRIDRNRPPDSAPSG